MKRSPTKTKPPSRKRVRRRAGASVVELASLLLNRGATPAMVGEIANWAFARAAADQCRFNSGKANLSRVAACTGLSRASARMLLSSKAPSLGLPTALERITSGWRRDAEFLNSKGQPKKLAEKGSSGSFIHLVRRYAGDLPYRAVMEELLRCRAVVVQKGGLSLRTSRAQISALNFRTLDPIARELGMALRRSDTKRNSV
jgi:hypothetical protein